MLFGKGQGFLDEKPISQIDYENIINAGFKHVELIPIHVREYYKTKDDFIKFLIKVPIINEFSQSEKLELNLVEKYIEENTFKKGILLVRRYYGIVAEK